MSPLKYETYGKWILAGEHAVLRGKPALVFPLLSRQVQYTWTPQESGFEFQIQGESAQQMQLVFPGLMDEALKQINKKRANLKGRLSVQSHLPLGAGLGASAAYCVGVARLFVLKRWINETEIYEFARKLEDLFHGESSGVDIAAALRREPTYFIREAEQRTIKLKWKPNWYLSYSGERGVTSECVAKVKELWESSSRRAEKIDIAMHQSVDLAVESLQSSEGSGLPMLAQSIDVARDCFHQWGLCGGRLGEHMKWLSDEGALSVKPTGSGGGGHVLSLWESQPPEKLMGKLFAVGSYA